MLQHVYGLYPDEVLINDYNYRAGNDYDCGDRVEDTLMSDA